MQLRNGRAGTVLAGGMDELTNNSFLIMERLGHWRSRAVDNLELFKTDGRGSIAGEGAAFFLTFPHIITICIRCSGGSLYL